MLGLSFYLLFYGGEGGGGGWGRRCNFVFEVVEVIMFSVLEATVKQNR